MKKYRLFNPTKILFMFLVFLLFAFFPTVSKATGPYNILFYYSSCSALGSTLLEPVTALRNAGNTVTVVDVDGGGACNTTPYNPTETWTNYDQVWDARFYPDNAHLCNAWVNESDYFSPQWQAKAQDYIQNHCGNFFLQGENAGFATRNVGDVAFLQTVGAVSGSYIGCPTGSANSNDDFSLGSVIASSLPGATQFEGSEVGGIPVADLNGTAFVTSTGPWNSSGSVNRAIAAGWSGTGQMTGLTGASVGKLFMSWDTSMWDGGNYTGGNVAISNNFVVQIANWLDKPVCNTPTFTPTPGCGGSSSSPYLNLQVVCAAQGAQNQDFGVRITNYSASPVTLSDFSIVTWLYESAADNMHQFNNSAGQTCNAGGSSCNNVNLSGQNTTAGAVAACTSIAGHFANQSVTFNLGAGSTIPISPNGGYWQSQNDMFRIGRNNPQMDSGNWADDWSHIGTGVGNCQDALYHDSPYYLLLYKGSVVQESLDTSGTVDPNTGQIPCVTLPGACTPTPTATPPPSFTISKRVEATTAAPNALILYDVDYSYANTAVTITDLLPINALFVTLGPSGTYGSGTVTWTLPFSAAPQSGTVWVLTQVLSGTSNGAQLVNSAVASNGVSAVGSNGVTTTIADSNLAVTLTESATSLAAGSSVTYTLQWGADGQSLQWYDSYDNNSNGASNGSVVGFDGTGYTKTGASGSFTVAVDPQGNHYLNALPGGSGGYPLLLRNGPTLDICQGEIVEGDMFIPNGAPTGADATMVLAYGVNAGVTQAYMIAMSLDNGPGNFFLQKNNGASVTYPVTLPDSSLPVSIQTGIWYTVKAQITKVGGNLQIQGKIWQRGTAEPVSWPLTYSDTTPFPCGLNWQQGWQADGTADPQGESYTNLKVFGPGPVLNPQIINWVDSGTTIVNGGVNYIGSTLPNGGVETGSGGGPITFNWTGNFLSQPTGGMAQWWGNVACPGPVYTTFTMKADTVVLATSNVVTLTVTGCGTPTNTPTPTPSPTPTNSPTPFNTPTPTISPTPTATPPGLHVWPIPFDPKFAVGGTLKAYQVPAGSSLYIYTVSGELVVDPLTPDNTGLITWNGRNKNGVVVSTGTYYYVIRNGSSTLLTGKILVLIE